MRGSATAGNAGTVLLGALLTTWPAVVNGYPLLYPDSMSYLKQGAPVARALFLHQPSLYYGGRSLIYSLGILPLHWNVTPWPVVLFNALVTAWTLWLIVRSFEPMRPRASYLAVVGGLSLLTGIGWYVGWIMPDLFGPLLYLAIYLIVFASESLSRLERAALLVLAWWSAAVHITHLLIGAALCVFLLALLASPRRLGRQRLRPIVTIAAVLAVAAASQLALHAYLLGSPSLTGARPPFLLARVVADGPGRWYLQRHCPELRAEICTRALPDSVAGFLWTEGSIWETSTPAQQERLRQEEMPIVLGTLREYPGAELAASAASFWRQLHSFALADYDPNGWILAQLDSVLPGQRSHYLASRQQRETLPDDQFSVVQDVAVAVSLLVIVAWALFGRNLRSPRLAGLAAIVGFTVVVNAAVTGVLSNVEDRYQARVIWLVPLLASIIVVRRVSGERSAARG